VAEDAWEGGRLITTTDNADKHGKGHHLWLQVTYFL